MFAFELAKRAQFPDSGIENLAPVRELIPLREVFRQGAARRKIFLCII